MENLESLYGDEMRAFLERHKEDPRVTAVACGPDESIADAIARAEAMRPVVAEWEREARMDRRTSALKAAGWSLLCWAVGFADRDLWAWLVGR